MSNAAGGEGKVVIFSDANARWPAKYDWGMGGSVRVPSAQGPLCTRPGSGPVFVHDLSPGRLDLHKRKASDIQVQGDLSNSGSIAGRQIVRLTAENVHNLGGRIDGEAVGVATRNDLSNIGGTISANSALVATAGRDIHIASTTQM